MPGIIMSELFSRLGEDKAFRDRFAKDPATVLREAGYDPDQLELPSQIDPEALEKRVTRIRKGEETLEGTEAELSRLTANELWEKFAIVRLREGADPVSASVVHGPATAVVYGTTATNVVTSTITGTSGGSNFMLSEAQAHGLRDLIGFDPELLTFTIKGPDGVSVGELNAKTVEALLKRLDP